MPEGAPPVLDWIALYAQDATGYDNLCALVSRAQLTAVRDGLQQLEAAAQVLHDGRTQALVDACRPEMAAS